MSQLADRLQIVNTDAVVVNQIQRNLQISTDLKTIRDSKRIFQISTDLKLVRESSIAENQSHAHDINQTPTAPEPKPNTTTTASQHLNTIPSQHQQSRSNTTP
jgi:hypothetical protein